MEKNNMSKKIMFNDKHRLTEAVLNGTKTMTRRVEKIVSSTKSFDKIFEIEGGFDDKGNWVFTLYNSNMEIIGDIIPRYSIGEILSIAQSYKDIIKYSSELKNTILDDNGFPKKEYMAGYTNKMFVKPELMPHHIQITDMKLEQLQNISNEDCLREGIWTYDDSKLYYYINKKGHVSGFDTPKEAFSSLINDVNGKNTWESNPLVVVYTFKLID